MANTKHCPRCDEDKPLSEFWKNRRPNGKEITQPYCKPCQNAYVREWHANNGGRAKRSQYLYRTYGIIDTEYDALVEKQGGVCAVCGRVGVRRRKFLDVDHCHTCDEIRGALCTDCNSAAGLMRDDPEVIRQLLAYVEQHAEVACQPRAC